MAAVYYNPKTWETYAEGTKFNFMPASPGSDDGWTRQGPSDAFWYLDNGAQPAGYRTAYDGSGWGATSYWAEADPNFTPVAYGDMWQDYLKQYAGKSKTLNYLNTLHSTYGLQPKDIEAAFPSYVANSNTDANAQSRDWQGDEGTLYMIGNGLDYLNPNAAYKGSWQPLWDRGAYNSQQYYIGKNVQDAQNVGGSDWDDLKGIALGFATVLSAGAVAGAFAGGGAAGSLAEVGAQAAAAGDAGFLTAGGVATPATGGSFVGSGGLLGGTGNAIADAALNGVVRGGVTSALTGGDPVTGMISGGVSGGIGSMLPDLGSAALNNAAQGAVSGGVGAAVNGGDILTGAAAGGAASGVGTLVREAIPTDIGGNALTSAAAGGAAGAVGSAIAGGDVGTGLIRGAVTGGTTGALTDAGADPLVAGAAGTAAGGLITAPTPDAGTPAAQQQQTATTIGAGLGFSVVLPQFQDVRRRDMQWGSRLSGG